MKRHFWLTVVTVVLTLALAASPAVAQTMYYHPNSGNYWYCDYYGSDYYCQDERGNWFPASPTWYDASYAEMLRIFGQGVL